MCVCLHCEHSTLSVFVPACNAMFHSCVISMLQFPAGLSKQKNITHDQDTKGTLEGTMILQSISTVTFAVSANANGVFA